MRLKFKNRVDIPQGFDTGVDLAFAIQQFNNGSLDSLCFARVRDKNGCKKDGNLCYHCILHMSYHDSGIALYPDEKIRLFAEFACQEGYSVDRYDCRCRPKNLASPSVTRLGA